MKPYLRVKLTSLPLLLLAVGVSGTTAQRAYADPPSAVAVSVPTKADPAAYELLHVAHDRRSNLPKDLTGFSADVTVNDNGTETTGSVAYSKAKGLEMQIPQASKEAQDWLRSALLSAVAHRMAGDFARGDGSNPITFTSDDHSPLGRQVALNDNFHSLYRVKDNQITEVTRTMGNLRLTITMLENIVVDNGQYLPKHFAVTYFDAKTGAVEHAEYFTDTHSRIDGAWMPTARRVVFAAPTGITTRSYELKNVRLTRSAATQAKR